MESENLVNENEILQNETEAGESTAEVVAVDYTEILEQVYGEMQTQTELLAEIKKQDESLLDNVVKGYKEIVEARWALGVILAFYILSFCWSCMRQWRKNVLKMGE